MSEFMEKYQIRKGLSLAFSGAKSAWEWTRDRLWPVYSAAIMISLFHMIAVAGEKQIIADHYYGNTDGSFEEKKEELVKNSKKYYNEEVSLAVKERVWRLSDSAFQREYASRHGSD